VSFFTSGLWERRFSTCTAPNARQLRECNAISVTVMLLNGVNCYGGVTIGSTGGFRVENTGSETVSRA